ncbi:hypothetical protein MOQ72_02635 [Saccharopolyspora sp. K220]|uniref:hypothetical protein n=1 Tax=Saccharopolyspora soli TaxID=2926618 RepID=UPI001F57D820|nr:hypothetical protein [Saccharopolyspora soli]MCI2416307.1 hypothetical protein [Saccharopolyspora soli]
MTTYQEVRDDMAACLRRLMDMENVIVLSATEFHFPERNEFMPLMDDLRRAHYALDRILQDEQRENRE